MTMGAAAQPRSTFVEVAGLRHHVIEWGDPEAVPLLMLHGFTSSTTTAWGESAPRLANRFRVVGIDLRGHGESDWAPDADYTLRAYSDDIESVLDRMDLEPQFVVGHSLGGRIAVLHAARHPGAVRRLILVDARMRGGRRVPDILDRRPDRFGSMDAAMEFAREILHEPGERFRDQFVEQPDGTASWRCDLAGIRHSRLEPDLLLEDGQWDEYHALECPKLVLIAGRTPIRPEDIEAMSSSVGPVRIERYAESGHSLHLDEPDRFLMDVNDFFDLE
ncbi:MAG: alpha/beta hydrolase [Actinomycetota bacterium]